MELTNYGSLNIFFSNLIKYTIFIARKSCTIQYKLQLINTCLKISGPFKNLEKSILIMDSFGSHKDDLQMAL